MQQVEMVEVAAVVSAASFVGSFVGSSSGQWRKVVQLSRLVEFRSMTVGVVSAADCSSVGEWMVLQ